MTPPPNDAWIACPDGELARFAARRRSRRRAHQLGTVAVIAIAMLIGQRWFAGGIPAVLHPLDPSYGGIVCSDVHAKLDRFIDGQLDAATAARIEAHVEQCPPCGSLLAAARARLPGQARRPAVTDPLQWRRSPAFAALERAPVSRRALPARGR
jgi:hypothetical protein